MIRTCAFIDYQKVVSFVLRIMPKWFDKEIEMEIWGELEWWEFWGEWQISNKANLDKELTPRTSISAHLTQTQWASCDPRVPRAWLSWLLADGASKEKLTEIWSKVSVWKNVLSWFLLLWKHSGCHGGGRSKLEALRSNLRGHSIWFEN
jgi:hypothetical protein